MDVHAKLDELVAIVEGARAMPMSASCVVNRGDVLAHLEQLRAMLPAELASAHEVLADREAVVAEGRAEAQRIVEAAKAERVRMLNRTDVVRDAAAEARRQLDEAQADAERMRLEVDDYVDGKLANFEVVLHKTLHAVERGRAKISGRHDLDDLSGAAFEDAPLRD